MKELRTIIFEEREAIAAVVEFCRRNGRSLPAGTLTGFTVAGEEAARPCLAVTDDHGGRHDLSFERAEVAAALVSYCLTRNVPLPRGAAKSIMDVGGRVMLAFEMSHRLSGGLAAGRVPRV